MINQQLLALKSFVKYVKLLAKRIHQLVYSCFTLRFAVGGIPCAKHGSNIVNISVRKVMLLL